jgi:hypothetical protein
MTLSETKIDKSSCVEKVAIARPAGPAAFLDPFFRLPFATGQQYTQLPWQDV